MKDPFTVDELQPARFLWNPEKELKGMRYCRGLPRGHRRWNPEKELKARRAPAPKGRWCQKWNPEKELKVHSLWSHTFLADLKWNPEKELKARWADRVGLRGLLFVESGEGIESLSPAARPPYCRELGWNPEKELKAGTYLASSKLGTQVESGEGIESYNRRIPVVVAQPLPVESGEGIERQRGSRDP